MSTPEPQLTVAEVEDNILRQLFLVSLEAPAKYDYVYLKKTADELLSEGKELMISREMMETILKDLLYGDILGEEHPPFQYLLNLYRRVCRKRERFPRHPIKLRNEMLIVWRQLKDLVVRYGTMVVGNPGDFPRETMTLYELILNAVDDEDVDVDVDGEEAALWLNKFLGDIFNKDASYELLEGGLKQVYEDLRKNVSKVSAAGFFQDPLKVLCWLVKSKVGAMGLVNNPWWKPPEGMPLNGRDIEMLSILGLFFHVSVLPDHPDFKSEPDVGQICFSEASSRERSDLTSMFGPLRTAMKILWDTMAEIIRSLIKCANVSTTVIDYFAGVIYLNLGRARLVVDPLLWASSGMFVNFGAILLRLCDLEKMNQVVPDYVYLGKLFFESTALSASSEEVSEWITSKAKEEKPVFPFTCFSFFATAKVLKLGLLKAISDLKDLNQVITIEKATLSSFKARQGQDPSSELQQAITDLEKRIELHSQEKLCYEVQLMDVDLIHRALSYYRQMVIWLVGLVGGFKMPLPSNCPGEFAHLPQHFVEDILDFLIFVSPIPKVLDREKLDDFMQFFIMFMSSPGYVRSPYLRGKMVKVFKYWMSRNATKIFLDKNELSRDYLLLNLLKLFADVEVTDSEKFNIRYDIVKILEVLWKIPSHCATWKEIAEGEENGVHRRFLDFLITDINDLLGDILHDTVKLKEIEDKTSNMVEWEMRTEEERQEITQSLRSQEDAISIDMELAKRDVSLLAFTSEQITAPLLLPGMVEQVATMLNYFLIQLVGRGGKLLTLRDTERCKFQPTVLVLLKQIVTIYVNMAEGDIANTFPVAIISSSYQEQLFGDAANSLRNTSEDPSFIEKFVALGARAEVAASAARVSGVIPPEFLDPIQCTVMEDPVTLPSSNIMDRAVIEKLLESRSEDPFTRLYLTVEMLRPDPVLKARITEFMQVHNQL